MAKEIKSGGISTLISEFKRRAFGDSGSDFSAVVHPSLKECTSLLNADVATFGRSVEALLAKHRKDIIRKLKSFFLYSFFLRSSVRTHSYRRCCYRHLQCCCCSLACHLCFESQSRRL
jgi:hypothetical protein